VVIVTGSFEQIIALFAVLFLVLVNRDNLPGMLRADVQLDGS
jgi:hypothetical protein